MKKMCQILTLIVIFTNNSYGSELAHKELKIEPIIIKNLLTSIQPVLGNFDVRIKKEDRTYYHYEYITSLYLLA